MYHDRYHGIAVFELGHPHMVQTAKPSAHGTTCFKIRELEFSAKLWGAHFLSAMLWLNMVARARLEANLVNFMRESAEKDEIKPEKYVILMDIVRLR